MTTALTITTRRILDRLAVPHSGGHTCTSGVWVPHRDLCSVREDINELIALTEHMENRVHEAAHTPGQVEVVASALLAETPLTELDPETAEAWRYIARSAIESLAYLLDQESGAPASV